MRISPLARHFFSSAVLVCLLGHPAHCAGQQQPPSAPAPAVDLFSDTWVGTDALGRPVATAPEAPAPRQGRFVGMFYFLTHGNAQYYAQNPSPLEYGVYGDDPRVLRDNTEIIRQAGGDPLTKPEAWKEAGTYWWGQPAAGYFLADDPWMVRHDLQMLANAGVDVLIFDVTNAPVYVKAYENVLGTAEAMRKEGLATPQFMFITYSSTGPVIDRLYDTIYATGRYKDLWFLWQGKPLAFGNPAGSKPNTAPPRAEVRDFFTWRYSWANTGGPSGNGKDEWEWADSGDPQRSGWHDDPQKPEEVAVMAGGWANGDLGRSYQGGDQPAGKPGKEPPLDALDLAADRAKGDFFAQQWRNALQIDPQFVFVTGWNEWTAGRQYNPGVHMLGHVTQPGQYYFVDNFNEEFSRDLMPMKGGYADNYYMQLVDYVRQFKGARPVPVAHGLNHLKLDDPFTAWKDVEPSYRAPASYTMHRDWLGWGGLRYVDATGRNDIVEAKVACDEDTIYFYARTQDKLTPSTDPKWMQLLIDADRDPKTGWNGYDYIVNEKAGDRGTTTLRRFSDGQTWEVKYRAADNELVVAVPRALLGLTDPANTTFDFHWVDNAPAGTGDIADWWYVGNSAPTGRFNYRYTDQP
jgi:hypothetical protein